ncbi:FecR domain-containing protein [Pseudomonas mosselii]|uniref:FecR domain-containing protein n=1 Tax=Pseudomonas mosselii TaxID=78327 RepID=UPI000A11BBDE|nr:FecR family protein [Pseudomonas mosselii]ATB65323.1 amino acid ABC transporter substrate-binding protein [Pseudomonas mosselii]MDH1101951.1 FecR family protein [Pseudomonas mosselii]MDH1508160.1 FecR family protein [Pseudomonas mosselii]MDH1656879.1 FecR family protein [Pseudomonas mosselii]MDH1718139.1 FecR family protein [Pseudomonas mosselii]
MSDDVLDQAIGWLVRLESAQHAPALCAACLVWRQSDPRHEATWQALQEAQACFSQARELPEGVALRALTAPERADRRQALKLLTLGLLGLGLSGTALQHSPWRLSLADYSTRTAERRHVQLADGSELQLNSRSAVNVRFSATERRVELLEGQVYVRVQGDTRQRPLCVTSAEASLWTFDAAFDVCQARGNTRLAIDQGQVAIQVPGRAQQLAKAGEQYRIDHHGAQPLANPQAQGSAWTRGLLIANDMPLAELADTLARQREGWVGCDPAVAGLRVSGVFQLDDTDNALRSLAHTWPVRLQWRTALWVRILPA